MNTQSQQKNTDSIYRNIFFSLSVISFITSTIISNGYLAIIAVASFLVGFNFWAKISGSYLHLKLLQRSSNSIKWAIGIIFLSSVPFIIIFQEKLTEYFSETIGFFIVTVMISGYILYFILNYFIPIRDMSDDLSRLPELNFKTINKYDTEFDYTRDVLERINDQINSEIQLLNTSNKGLEESFDLLSSSEVKKIELEAGDVWVMSGDLEADSQDTHIKENVVRKLALKGKYWYIAPDTDKVRNNWDSMKKFWKNHVELDKDTLKNVEFIPLPKDEWLQAHDVVIYHKTDSTVNRIVEFISLGDGADIYHELSWKDNADLIQAVATQIRKDA